jgi:hypothetical protein
MNPIFTAFSLFLGCEVGNDSVTSSRYLAEPAFCGAQKTKASGNDVGSRSRQVDARSGSGEWIHQYLAVGRPGLEVIERLADFVEGDRAADETGGVHRSAFEEAGGRSELIVAVVHGVPDLDFFHDGGNMAELVRDQADPGDDDSTVDDRGIDSALNEVGDAGALENDIETTRWCSVRRIVSAGGTEGRSVPPPGCGGVADDYFTGTEAAGPRDHRGADIAAAEDEHAFFGAEIGRRDSVEAHGQRLHKRPESAEIPSKRDGGSGGDPYVLGERPLGRAEPQRVDLLAVPGLTVEAPPAATARSERQRSGKLTGSPALDASAHRDNLAAELVAEYRPGTKAFVGLEVRATDPTSLHAQY